MVVNNCAAALLLAMAALAKGKPVIVSRGELIEIGGEFRIPDILAASGARLAEVGTTNRTRIGDYRGAVTDKTGLILKVHPSNYRVIGFTATPAASELSALARKHGIPFLFDIGSGLLHHGHGHPVDEPSVSDALEQGADLVTFSADKLLGGPQAGIIVGRADLLERLRGTRSREPSAWADADGGPRAGARDRRDRPGDGAPGVPDAPRVARDRARAGPSSCPRRSAVSSRARASCGASRPSAGARCRARVSRRGAFGSGYRMRPRSRRACGRAHRPRSPGWRTRSSCSTAGR